MLDHDALFSLEGRTALVTGASRGIGAMIAEGLIGAGARVLICGRKAGELEETAARIGAEPIAADLSHEEGVAALAQALAARTDALDILVNNAGTAWGAPFGEFPRSGFARVMDLNLLAPFALSQALHELLCAAARPDRPARIVNVSSVDGLRPPSTPAWSYSASKAGLNMLTRHLARSLLADNITCNAVAPGLFETRFSSHMFDPDHPAYSDRPEIPMGRPGAPEDIAAAVIYLCARSGNYLTGVILPVSGGIACL